MKSSIRMPFVEAMIKYHNEQVYPLHTPGHKGGRGMEQLLAKQFNEAALAMDVSLMGELDDLHAPTTYILEAQTLLAKLYGSDAAFWAVNGTTQAICAMLMIACLPGDKVLVPRNAHRSVAGGLLLGDLEPVYVLPCYDKEFSINTQVAPEVILSALQEHKNIKAVVLTNPNYYGQAADIAEIAKYCHAHGAVLLVDEAHGPHLGFHEELPPSALSLGADAVAQSTHKLLGAMTQCSVLHVMAKHLDLARAADVMSLLTTTSPNHLLMASLDAARAQMEDKGKELLAQALKASDLLRSALKKIPKLKVLNTDCLGKDGVIGLDRTKVLINVRDLGVTGAYVGELLRAAGIAVELTDEENVLFLLTFADDNAQFPQIVDKIVAVLQGLPQKEQQINKSVPVKLPLPQLVLPLKRAFNARKESILLTQAAGKIAGEQVSFYPPGIPILLPGELITEEIISYCQKMKALELVICGPADSSLKKVRVICDE